MTLGIGLPFAVLTFLASLTAPPLRGEYAQHIPLLVRVPAVNSHRAYTYMRARTRTLHLGSYVRVYDAAVDFGRGPLAATMTMECVDPDYFQLFDARPLLGTTFHNTDNIATSAPRILLAHHIWTSYLGGTAEAIGTTIGVNGRQYTVSGVMPPNFGGVDSPGADAWTPLAASPAQCMAIRDPRGWRDLPLTTIGKLRDPLTIAAAAQEVGAHLDALEALNAYRGDFAPVEPLFGPRVAQMPVIMRWTGASAVLVVLLAGVSTGLLLLLSMVQRRIEYAVRRQLGARRRSLGLQLLSETVALGLMCAVPAIATATWTVLFMDSMIPARAVDRFLTPTVLVGMALAVVGGCVVSGLPAILVGARTPIGLVRIGDVGSVSRRQSRCLTALLTIQIAAAVALAMLAGLFVRTAVALTSDTGFDLDRVVLAVVAQGTDDATRRAAFEVATDRARAVPGVSRTALSSGTPFGAARVAAVRRAASSWTMATVIEVSPGYFEAMGTRILRGRSFTAADARDAIIVSAGLASRLWPEDEALGSCLFVTDRPECVTVVGISESRRGQVVTLTADEVFLPLLAEGVPQALVVRVQTPSRDVTDNLARVLQGPGGQTGAAAPRLRVRRLADLAGGQTAAVRLAASVGGAFGLLAVLLAGVGVYGTTAAAVRYRMPEMRLRLALGARPGDIAWLLAKRGLLALAAGTVVGTGGVAALAPVVETLLFGVTPLDWATLGAAVGAVAAAVTIGVGVMALRVVLRLGPRVVSTHL